MKNISYIELFFAQKGKCFYCGKMMSHVRFNVSTKKKKKKKIGWTIDHFFPKSKGNGTDNNKVLCHQYCNVQKGDREPTKNEMSKFHHLYGQIINRREQGMQFEVEINQEVS